MKRIRTQIFRYHDDSCEARAFSCCGWSEKQPVLSVFVSITARVTLTARSLEIFLRLMDPIVLRHILLAAAFVAHI